ncbi:MAG: IMP dehydrogenase, partial [Lentisphaerae bacterium]|nr:IMP dehydrogenase [Lentisphaerota bacterium]
MSKSTKRAMDNFMKTSGNEAITFDDVLLVPDYADFLPAETDISGRLTTNITMPIPFVSAAMDTVSEGRMAIAMAMLGGIGVIHKNLAPDVQAQEVESVKHYLNGSIRQPVTFRDTDTLKTIFETKIAKSHSFSGFPILNSSDQLVGIITSSDMKFARNPSIMVSKMMTSNVVTASPRTGLKKAYDVMIKHKIGKLPLVDNKGRLTGLYSFSDVKTLIEKAEPMFNRDVRHRLRVGAALGAKDFDRVEKLAHKGVDVLVIDTAHGHSKNVVEMCKWIKKNFAEIDVIAGNIARAEAALALQKAGADAVKVG